jgi:hypothetical protein
MIYHRLPCEIGPSQAGNHTHQNYRLAARGRLLAGLLVDDTRKIGLLHLQLEFALPPLGSILPGLSIGALVGVI